MSTTQIVVAALFAVVVLVPLMLVINPPNRWVSSIWGGKKNR